jgi:hypothetical protein
MKIRFYRDPETDEPHIYAHNVDEDEVADVLESPGEDRPGRGGRGWPLARPALGVTFG